MAADVGGAGAAAVCFPPEDDVPLARGVTVVVPLGTAAFGWGLPAQSALAACTLNSRDASGGVVHALSMVPIPFDPKGAVGKGWATPHRP